jgi:putative tryptophan/tyrosine transport system substrate-binding protein
MRRRDFILASSAALAWPFAAAAQEPGRAYRVGGLSVNPRDAPIIVAMFDELRKLGFVEGQNLMIDWRAYEPHGDLAAQFEAIVKSHPPTSFTPADLLQFAQPRRRRQRYRSSGFPMIWSGLDW